MHDYEALHYDKEKLKEACEYEIQHTRAHSYRARTRAAQSQFTAWRKLHLVIALLRNHV